MWCLFIIFIVVLLVYCLEKPKSKSYIPKNTYTIYSIIHKPQIPNNRIRNLYSRISRSPMRNQYYSNMCPHYFRTLTKFKVPLRTNCISKLN